MSLLNLMMAVKPNDGLDSAGGETDIATSFDVTIE